MEKDPTWWKNDISKSLRTKLNKRSKLYNKHANLEDKTLNAVNFNMRNFFKGILKGLSSDYTKVSQDSEYYNDEGNYQFVRYDFTNNKKEYCLEVMYYDEEGTVKVRIFDENDILIESYDFSITTIDKAIDVVLDFVEYQIG